MVERSVDKVLSAMPPTFSEAAAAALADASFGVEGAARTLTSERDQAFEIHGTGADGQPDDVVLKISNAAEDPSRLDMEALPSCGSPRSIRPCQSCCRDVSKGPRRSRAMRPPTAWRSPRPITRARTNCAFTTDFRARHRWMS